MISGRQIRAARALLGITQAALARLVDMSTTGLNNVESGQGDPRSSTLRKIQSALEAAGIEFIPENGGGAGVRFRDRA